MAGRRVRDRRLYYGVRRVVVWVCAFCGGRGRVRIGGGGDVLWCGQSA